MKVEIFHELHEEYIINKQIYTIINVIPENPVGI